MTYFRMSELILPEKRLYEGLFCVKRKQKFEKTFHIEF
jgi:hypothetical protein